MSTTVCLCLSVCLSVRPDIFARLCGSRVSGPAVTATLIAESQSFQASLSVSQRELKWQTHV